MSSRGVPAQPWPAHWHADHRVGAFAAVAFAPIMRVFLAGASSVIGVRLIRLLLAAGHRVAGMTRSPGKTETLSRLGVQPDHVEA